MPLNTLSYRPEIDGLRALAVLSVVFYHAQLVLFGRDWFVGGFIGVDIFFVISGYLITRIILKEITSKGSFDYLHFYERRARRLFPGLFLVIIVSVPFAWERLQATDLVDYGQSVLATIFFASNFFFYLTTTEYGAESALLMPFLHTWSLGVEEQFYFVFPIFVIGAFKFFRKQFLPVLVGLTLVSLQFSESMHVRNSDLNFYLPVSRFWELAAGSMLAYRELSQKVEADGIAGKMLPMLGLYLIFYSILFFDNATPHPSFNTLVPIVGTILIIGFASKDELVGKALGSKPLVSVGLISYSAYLWHYPIFAFSRMGNTPTNYDKFEWIVLTFCLAILSYFFVERPFRNNLIITKKIFWISFFSCFCVLFCAFSLLIHLFSTPNFESSTKFNQNALLDKSGYQRAWQRHFHDSSETIEFDKINRTKVLIIGNSHAVDLFNVLSYSSLEEHYDWGLVSPKTKNSDTYQVWCFNRFILNGNTECYKGFMYDDLDRKLKQADIVIFATRWNWNDDDIKDLPEVIKRLKIDHEKHVVLVGNSFEMKIAEYRKIPLREFLISEGRRPTRVEEGQIGQRMFETRNSEKIQTLNKELSGIASLLGVPFVDITTNYCDYSAKECEVFTEDGYLINWDGNHISIKGAQYIGKNFHKKFAGALNKNNYNF